MCDHSNESSPWVHSKAPVKWVQLVTQLVTTWYGKCLNPGVSVVRLAWSSEWGSHDHARQTIVKWSYTTVHCVWSYSQQDSMNSHKIALNYTATRTIVMLQRCRKKLWSKSNLVQHFSAHFMQHHATGWPNQCNTVSECDNVPKCCMKSRCFCFVTVCVVLTSC